MNSELQILRTENIGFRYYDQSSFKDKDKKVNSSLASLHGSYCLYSTPLSPPPCEEVKKSLDPFKQLMLTLMQLRLNVSTTFLSYLFNASLSTASRVVTDVMFIHLKPLLIWPEREDLQKTMPI